MFDNIGTKIKSLAKIVCWVGIIITVIAGIVMLASGDDISSPIGLVLIVAGPIGSWISSFFVYGFGELIEKASEIAENTKPKGVPPISSQKVAEGVENEDKKALLKKWREQGLITEEEYQQKMNRL